MYMTSLERMWGYLHDQRNCVDENLFVTDPYRYTSDFIDMLVRNPEVVSQLKSKMKIEKMNSSVLFNILRGGYCMSEFRIVKMMRIGNFYEYLAQEFPELAVPDQESKKLRNIK